MELKPAEFGHTGRSMQIVNRLVARIDENRSWIVFYDPLKCLPARKGCYLSCVQRELSFKKLKNRFIRVRYGKVTVDQAIFRPASQYFGVTRIRNAITIGHGDVLKHNAARRKCGPEVRHERLPAFDFAGEVESFETIARTAHARRAFMRKQRIQTLENLLPAQTVGCHQDEVVGCGRVLSDERERREQRQ